jgi:hypothetical protein
MKQQAKKITSERFAQWQKDFGEAQAVPMLIIGCVIGTTGKLPQEAIIIMNSQGKNDAEMLVFLRSICSDLEARLQ